MSDAAALDLQTFKNGMRLLTAAFGIPASDALSDAYYLALGNLDPALFTATVADLLATAEYFPRPREILARAHQLDRGAGDRADRDRLIRSALTNGFLPHGWDRARVEGECRRLRIGTPATIRAKLEIEG